MKRILILGMIMVLAAIIAACGNETTGGESSGSTANENDNDNLNGETIVLQVGHTLSETSHYQEGLEYFKELLEDRSNGRLSIQIFPNGQLGGERDMVEGLQLGSIDMVLTSTGPMSGFVEELTVVDLPFLFRDAEHAHNVLDGEIGQELLAKLEEYGFKGLSWWENGFRNVTNNVRPIEKPEDLQGLTIRTMENDIHMAAFEALGARPTPMAFTELFTALQQGTIDGQENPIPVINSSRFYEVQKYLTLTRHFYNPSILLMSESRFNELDSELQQILIEVAREGAIYEREVIARMDEEFLDNLEANGMEIVYDVDIEPFIEAVQPVYEQYADFFGQDLIDAIKNHK